jgi:hypothetical protein
MRRGLSRQLAEGHEGALSLENRIDGPGCVARLRLPYVGAIPESRYPVLRYPKRTYHRNARSVRIQIEF